MTTTTTTLTSQMNIKNLPTIQCGIRVDAAPHNDSLSSSSETTWRDKVIVIKITNCSDHKLWYSSLVGKYVPFVRHLLSDNCFMSIERDGYKNIVRVQDAELVEITGDEIDYIHYY